MNKLLKRIGIVLGCIVGLLLVAVGVVYLISGIKVGKTYEVEVKGVAIPSDSASVAEGHHIVAAITKCMDCHGQNLEGKAVIDAQPLGVVYAPNLTSGKGGIGGRYEDADWVRAIRHGIKKDGSGLWIMPSEEYWHLDDNELGKVLAYVRSVPPVDHEVEPPTLGILGRFLLTTGQLPLISADNIDHDGITPAAPPPTVSVEYGKHLANIGGCTGCHRKDLSGGPVPGGPPDWPPAANLTPDPDGLGSYTEADFKQTIRTGIRKNGKALDNDAMPWRSASQMTDDEIAAIWLYLRSVPPKKQGT